MPMKWCHVTASHLPTNQPVMSTSFRHCSFHFSDKTPFANPFRILKIYKLIASDHSPLATGRVLVLYSQWLWQRPGQGPGTNGLYEPVCKFSHYTWTRTGTVTYCSTLFQSRPPFCSLWRYHNGLFTLSVSGTGKNGLYDIMQDVSHYTGTRTPLFLFVLVSVPDLSQCE